MEKINLITYTDPKSPIAEAYRTIRTNLQFAGVDKPMKSIVVTSAVQNAGKSTVISSLGVVMAQAGHKVVILDCDFRNPTIHKIFSLHNKGVTNYLAGSMDYHTLIQKVDTENLDILVSGPVAPNPSELLSSKKMAELLNSLRKEYDYVLIDTPPVLPVTDAAALSPKVDGVILVVPSGEATVSSLKLAKNRLRLAGANIVGCILNKVKVAGHMGYGYGYGYGEGYYGYYYYYGHKDGEGEHHHHHHHHTEDNTNQETNQNQANTK